MTRGTGRPKVVTRLIDERFVSVMGECVTEKTIGSPSIFKTIRSTEALVRMLSILDFESGRP